MYSLYYMRNSSVYPYKKYETPKLCQEWTNDIKTLETLRKQRSEWELYIDEQEKIRESDNVMGMVYVTIAIVSFVMHLTSN